jgi:hypothetical protein
MRVQERFAAAVCLFASTLLFVQSALATWQIDNANSQLNFVSVKAGDIAEVHKFTQLSGSINAKGDVEVTVHLASVDTRIPLRDERMREFLFETGIFPTASIHGHLELEPYANLDAGESIALPATLQLDLHGKRVAFVADLLVARLSAGRIMVTTRAPILLNTEDFELAAGVLELRELAGLDSISKSVPVNFVLTLVDDGK